MSQLTANSAMGEPALATNYPALRRENVYCSPSGLLSSALLGVAILGRRRESCFALLLSREQVRSVGLVGEDAAPRSENPEIRRIHKIVQIDRRIDPKKGMGNRDESAPPWRLRTVGVGGGCGAITAPLRTECSNLRRGAVLPAFRPPRAGRAGRACSSSLAGI